MTTLETVDRGELHGFLHRPDAAPIATLALTHGAGSNCDTVLLRAVAEGFAEAGVQVLRFDLAYRVRRPKDHRTRRAPPKTGWESRMLLRHCARITRTTGLYFSVVTRTVVARPRCWRPRTRNW